MLWLLCSMSMGNEGWSVEQVSMQLGKMVWVPGTDGALPVLCSSGQRMVLGPQCVGSGYMRGL